MESINKVLGLFLVTIISMFILGSSASSRTTPCTFDVGGKDGWVTKPSEDYSHWAQRNRFRVNDTLHFKYEKGSDSVLVVKKDDYDSCNPKNPIKKMDDGDSAFVFDKPGPFFFVTGNVENCKRGQKLNVVVLALTHHQHGHSLPPATSPAASPSPAAEVESSSSNVAPSPAKHSGSTRVRVSGGVTFGVSVAMSLLFSILG